MIYVGKSKKILVVDDDPAIVDVLQIILEMNGYEVVVSVNAESIEELYREHPNLMLVDIWMSGKDGREICRDVKSQQSTCHIPVVMISASMDVKRSAFAAGADDFIAKPFDLDELLRVVGKHISAVTQKKTNSQAA